MSTRKHHTKGTNNQTGEKVIIQTQVPMEVVNYPVRSLEVDDLGLELKHDFNFLTIAQMGPRKNLANNIRWFLEEFHDDEVGLVVKTNMMNCSTADGQYCLQSMKEMTKRLPRQEVQCSFTSRRLVSRTDELVIYSSKNERIRHSHAR